MPDIIARLLEEYRDVMPLVLLKKLSSRQVVGHKIELVPGATPPSQPSYRMSLRELDKLRKQLTKLIITGFIRPFKALYGAPILF